MVLHSFRLPNGQISGWNLLVSGGFSPIPAGAGHPFDHSGSPAEMRGIPPTTIGTLSNSVALMPNKWGLVPNPYSLGIMEPLRSARRVSSRIDRFAPYPMVNTGYPYPRRGNYADGSGVISPKSPKLGGQVCVRGGILVIVGE